MKFKTVTSSLLILAALAAALSVGTAGAVNGPQASTSISFTFTTTSNYPVTVGGSLPVKFDSIQLTTIVPQAYSFGAVAKTAPGSWITQLIWQFGDGSVLDVPYCCQSQVSDVQYHAYSQQGTYTVTVTAYDNTGNWGNAIITVNWDSPAPEFPIGGLTMVASLFAVLAAAALLKGQRFRIG